MILTHMLSIQPGCIDGTNKELTAVGIGSGVGHAQNTLAGMGQGKVFVFKFFAINRLATGTIVIGKVAAVERVRDESINPLQCCTHP